jgi:hypothetical protein
MRSPLKAAIPIAVAVGLVAASPAAAEKPAAKAKAAGGDVVELTYPSLVKTRVDRTERAIERATNRIENGNVTGAASTFKVIRRQLGAAWRGTKYVIRTTPPPPPAEDAMFRPRAKASGGAPTGPTLAAPADTAFLVLSTMHDTSAAVVQLIDGAHGTGLNALSTTLNYANNLRDKAIQDIVALAPPAPPAEDARVHAKASGDAPVGSTFDTVMPNVIPQIDDETQAIEGLKSDATDLTAGGRRLLDAAEAQIAKTKTVVNTTWPPVPAED